MTYINIYIYIYTGGLFTEIVVYVLLCCKCIYIILQEAYICFFFFWLKGNTIINKQLSQNG